MQPRSLSATIGGVERLGLTLSYCGALSTADCVTNNGNVTSQQISYATAAATYETGFSATQSYTYDPLNRLQSVSEGARLSQSFGYDPYGNRWISSQKGLVVSGLAATSQNDYNASTNRLVKSGVSFDTAGQQTGMPPFTLAYDGEGHTKSALSAINGNSYYEYDADGQRISKLAGAGAYRFTVFAYDGFGQLANEYGVEIGSLGGVEYMTSDHLGSKRLVTDSYGGVRARYDYLPFGEPLGVGVNGRNSEWYSVGAFPSTSDTRAVKFTGKERDAETGLDYFGARYMSSAQGRLTSADAPLLDQSPGDPQSWNLYSYVRNNPLIFTDPSGNACVVGSNGDYDDGGPGQKCSEARKA